MSRRPGGPEPAPRAGAPGHLLASLVLALLVLAAGAGPAPGPRPATPARAPGAVAPASRLPAPACLPTAPSSPAIASVVEDELAGRSGTYGVGVAHLDTGELYLRRADQRFPAASVYKLLVLYEARRQVALGRLQLDGELTVAAADAREPEPAGGPAPGDTLTVGEALEAMVTISSNSAAHALLRRLGREAVNRSAVELGLRESQVTAPGTSTGLVDADGDELATTSPRDILCYLTLLADGHLLGPAVSAEMRKLLFRQRLNDRIPALLPAGVRVAHKSGELPGVRNDAGIVYTPRGAYALVVLTRAVDEGDATAAIARLSRRLYELFTFR